LPRVSGVGSGGVKKKNFSDPPLEVKMSIYMGGGGWQS
jgi:hypothetical protein